MDQYKYYRINTILAFSIDDCILMAKTAKKIKGQSCI